MLALFCHVLTYSYFSSSGQLYEQINRGAMGLLLSPVITNLYVEGF
jgi:hypothetical protein